MPSANSFGEVVDFLEQHTDVIVLSDASEKAKVAIAPSMQGRVMTSTFGGSMGLSLGWINRDLIASGDTLPHINPYGGEDRFWLGPEGGQYSIFFKAGDPFDLDHWYTPAPIDIEPYEIVSQSEQEVHFKHTMQLQNYSDTVFELEVSRIIKLIAPQEAASLLDLEMPEQLDMVGYESSNTIENVGEQAWHEESGLLSIWILGMFNSGASTTVVVPFTTGTEEALGPIVNADYFGEVPQDRLSVQDGVLYFKGDGNYRSKIGLTPQRATDVLGSFDPITSTLTLVQYNKPDETTRYVNSMWELQDNPYRGDVVNSYNDGPPEPGAPGLGPFYELESSSPAAALGPNEHLTHVHRTFHFHGPEAQLDAIAQQTLGVSLAEIKSAL